MEVSSIYRLYHLKILKIATSQLLISALDLEMFSLDIKAQTDKRNEVTIKLHNVPVERCKKGCLFVTW